MVNRRKQTLIGVEVGSAKLLLSFEFLFGDDFKLSRNVAKHIIRGTLKQPVPSFTQC